ncbi:MAG: hypothetical protein M0Z52_12855 [Actinomycetota bacterium]|nr:hypothetical protein [Actinomycetota bacterium]
MKIAHLIQTNKNPELLRRKINFFSSANNAFFIHVDAKCDINDFASIKGDNVFFIGNRIPVFWGEYSMVKAILLLIRHALTAPAGFDYFLMETGSDYPLRSEEYISDFFEKNAGCEFIGAIQLPGGETANPQCGRDPEKISPGCARFIGNQKLNHLKSLRIPSDRPAIKLAMKAMSWAGLARRSYEKHLKLMEPFAGNTHWALTRSACEYIVNFFENNKRVCNFFEGTFGPDETIFHTILGNSVFKPRIRRHLFYEDWAQTGGGAKHGILERSSNKAGHPAYLNEGHLDIFEKSDKVLVSDIYGSCEALFARKFSDSNLALVDRLENIIKAKEAERAFTAGKTAAPA